METTRTDDARKVMDTAMEQVKTSLLAALGVSSMAGQAVADALSKARARVNESSEAARRNIEDLPSEWDDLRGRLDPAELRKLYQRLAESGEQTWDDVIEPQVKRGIEQIEEALQAAQKRVDGVTTDARERVDHVVGVLTRRAREAEEKVGGEADTGSTSAGSDKPGPVKADAARVPAKEPERSPAATARTSSGAPASESARTESARKKAMKPTTRSTRRTSSRQNGSTSDK